MNKVGEQNLLPPLCFHIINRTIKQKEETLDIMGKSRLLHRFTLLLSLLGLCACQREEERQPLSPENESAVPALKFVSMPESTVFVRVNGEPVTFGDLGRQIAYEEKIKRLNLERMSSPDIEGQLENFRIWRRTSVIPEYVNALLVDQEAKKKGIVASDERINEAIEKVLKSVKIASEDIFLQRMKMKKADFRAVVDKEVRRDLLLEALYPDIVDISTNDMREVAERFASFNAVAEATNAAQRAICAAIIDEVKKGLPFEEAFTKYNQVEAEKGCTWGYFYRQDLKNNEKLQTWAFSAPVGSVSGPFEWEDGLCVVKIANRTEGTKEEYSVSASVSTVDLQRITLLYSETLPVPEGDALRQKISEARRSESLVELIKKLHEGMQLEYPNGTMVDGAE